MNRYKNLWHDKLNVRKQPFYENDAPQVASHRGVTIFKLYANSFDFVLNGACITQRAGISKFKDVIDGILDGESPVGHAVADHIRENGFSSLSYEDYIQKWEKGQMA